VGAASSVSATLADPNESGVTLPIYDQRPPMLELKLKCGCDFRAAAISAAAASMEGQLSLDSYRRFCWAGA
jgi:hypothetical protein